MDRILARMPALDKRVGQLAVIAKWNMLVAAIHVTVV
jgi:hypothetical protein